MIHIPMIGTVFKPLLEKIQKKLFLKTLLWSQSRYNDWKSMGKSWTKIENIVDYDFRIENLHYSQATSPSNKIIFKKNKSCAADYFCFLIEAQSGKIKFQEHLEIKNADDSIYYFSLPNIPLMWINFHEDGCITQTLDDLRVTVLEAKYNNQVVAKNIKGPIHHPTGFDLLNDKWVEKWGKWWNLRAIDECKREIKLILKYNLISKYEKLHENSRSATNNIRIVKLYFGIMTFHFLKHMPTPIFWVSSWLGKRDIWERN